MVLKILIGESGVPGIEVFPDTGFNYIKNLNQIKELEMKFSATGTTSRSLFTLGGAVEIYDDSTLEFRGKIDNIVNFIGGTIGIHVSGVEADLATNLYESNLIPEKYVWTSTASATIFSDLLFNASSVIDKGTVDAGFDTDFRGTKGTPLWSIITNLARKTQQDISVTYKTGFYTGSPNALNVIDNLGSLTSVAVLNEGIHIKNVQRTQGLPRGNSIQVFGKGDGDDQILGVATDAPSISAYGTIGKVIIDKTIVSTAEATKLAEAELALNKDPPNIYDFDMLNPLYSGLSLGDIITINALDLDVVNEEVRIVGIAQGDANGRDFMSLQVVNPELKNLTITKNKVLAEIQARQNNDNSYMNGSGNQNTWGAGINAKTDYPLKIGFYLPASYIDDEVGNSNISELTFSYDIDKYKEQYGDATFDGADPQVQNSSANTAPTVSGTSGSITMTNNEGSDTFSENISSTWDAIMNERISGTFSMAYVDIEIEHDSWSGTDTWGLEIRLGATVKVTLLDLEYGTSNGPYKITIPVPIFQSIVADINVYMYSAGGYDYQGSMTVYATDETHSHSDGSYAAANHPHDDGTYDINAADIDDISISDGVGEAAGVNASSVNIYLDWWNTGGGGSWDNKHSILATGVTIDEDVDLTDGGTYPDAPGWWRVRLEPITATADFAQGIVRLKNAIDN